MVSFWYDGKIFSQRKKEDSVLWGQVLEGFSKFASTSPGFPIVKGQE